MENLEQKLITTMNIENKEFLSLYEQMIKGMNTNDTELRLEV